MFKLEQTTSAELIVKKSRFLAVAIPVVDEAEAKTAVALHSHGDANHNCWAWRVGQVYRFSDDGEPGGTAGKPILAAIDGQSVDQVAVIVTRWFGGVLLGTGGLIRAYGGAAAAALRNGSLIPFVATVAATIELDFTDLARVKARLSAMNGVHIADERFESFGAVMTVHLPEADFEPVSRLVADLTSGRTRLARGQD